ncbi:MAG: HlyD family type I secretion periplasmic adaptor subunit [Bauldia sp.]|nr:HlyD family type I secretion periplasmic adaptor subunit [Bauldia sp.]
MAARSPESRLRRLNLAGAATILALVGGAGVWANATSISGAVVAPGVVVVEGHLQRIQHPVGGVVRALNVQEGQRVEAGEILVQLDPTQARATLGIVTSGLDELNARRARLLAERDGAASIDFDPSAAGDPGALAEIMQSERHLFEIRAAARQSQEEGLHERIAQFEDEIEGLEAQLAARRQELMLVEADLARLNRLLASALVEQSAVSTREREAAGLRGQLGEITATIAQTRGRITETQLQILGIEQNFRSEVGGELREVEARIAELAERRIAAEDQLDNLTIVSPAAGIVHQLAVHTLGGVAAPGETLMMIVPEGDALTIEARVSPMEIDQVRLGQPAVIRFAAFNRRTTPEVVGSVARIGADIVQPAETVAPYYVVRIALPADLAGQLGESRLLPGMLVETFMQTDARTVMSYLVEPLADQIGRTFRER